MNSNQLKANFLMLTDFSKESYTALNYLIQLAKSVKGDIELFCITNSQPVQKSEDIEPTRVEKKLIALKEIIECEGIDVKTTHIIGEFELELKSKLKQTSQTVVISKNQSGDIGNSTYYLLNNYTGSVLVLNSECEFNTGNTIAIGCDNKSLKSCNLNLPALVSSNGEIPIIVLQSNEFKASTPDSNLKFPISKKLEVYYKTLNHKRMLDGLKEFIGNNNVKLLCICRKESSDSLLKRLLNSRKTTNDMVNSIKLPLLIMGK